MAGEDLYYMRAGSRGADIGGAHLERPHQRRYTSVERHSWNLAGGAAKFQRPPVSGMGKKGPGPGIWEEYIRHFVLGCRALPANAISHYFFD
jgi:hypothetical protein